MFIKLAAPTIPVSVTKHMRFSCSWLKYDWSSGDGGNGFFGCLFCCCCFLFSHFCLALQIRMKIFDGGWLAFVTFLIFPFMACWKLRLSNCNFNLFVALGSYFYFFFSCVHVYVYCLFFLGWGWWGLHVGALVVNLWGITCLTHLF